MILKLELNDQEAQALLQLIDLAVKSAGMQAAGAGLALTQKINEAGKAAQAAEEVNAPQAPESRQVRRRKEAEAAKKTPDEPAARV